MGALVRALHTDRRIDVLLNPKIVVEDNAVAEFFVGINTPFQTQSIANDLGTVITGNFEFRDVGSTIKITPIIGNNGIVTLEIEQEISSAAANNTIGGGTTTKTSAQERSIPRPEPQQLQAEAYKIPSAQPRRQPT